MYGSLFFVGTGGPTCNPSNIAIDKDGELPRTLLPPFPAHLACDSRGSVGQCVATLPPMSLASMLACLRAAVSLTHTLARIAHFFLFSLFLQATVFARRAQTALLMRASWPSASDRRTSWPSTIRPHALRAAAWPRPFRRSSSA
jgi:hypothetical protein